VVRIVCPPVNRNNDRAVRSSRIDNVIHVSWRSVRMFFWRRTNKLKNGLKLDDYECHGVLNNGALTH
jgi:hypothetical protein